MSKEVVKRPVKKAALGRGLNSLLGNPMESSEEAPQAKTNFTPKSPEPAQAVVHKSENQTSPRTMSFEVGVEKLFPRKDQPRRVFEKVHLESLASSIKQKGIIQPITVRKREEGGFEIVAGERRWRSAQLAGLEKVPVIIKEFDDKESLEVALIENIQRQDLNPIEEAEAYFNLIKKYRLTQQELADNLGKERVTLANVLRLLNLVPDVRKMVSENQISLGQAKVLVSVTDPKKQKSLAKKAAKDQLSVRALEKFIKKDNTSVSEDRPNQDEILKRSAVEALENELRSMLGTKVSIDYHQGKGKITVDFYSDEELNQVTDKIRKAWNK